MLREAGRKGGIIGEYVRVARTKEITPGTGKCIEALSARIAIFNVGGTFFAIEDTCTHRGGPLSEGALSGYQVTCPWHGAMFDITNGRVQRPPVAHDVKSYSVRVEGEEIAIALEPLAAAS